MMTCLRASAWKPSPESAGICSGSSMTSPFRWRPSCDGRATPPPSRSVYTPPPLRGKGYGGSVTAAVVEQAFAEGKTMACLYTDLRNPFSNRCYAKIGFKPVCDSAHIPRAVAQR